MRGRDGEGARMLYQDDQDNQWFNKKRGALRASMIRFFCLLILLILLRDGRGRGLGVSVS